MFRSVDLVGSPGVSSIMEVGSETYQHLCPHQQLHPQQQLQQKRKTVTHALEDQKKIYTDWANHYLAKSGHTRLIKDLQRDVADGVLLAEIIQVVANEKIADINGFPESRSQMIENIDACLGFLVAKGVNIKGLCAEEIRNGNLKAILGLFFTLSHFRQQQQQTLKQASNNVQLLQNNQPNRCTSPAMPPHSPPCSSSCPSPIHHTSSPCAQKPQTDLQPRYYSPTHILDSFFIDIDSIAAGCNISNQL